MHNLDASVHPLRRHAGLVFNLLCGLYFVTLGPLVADAAHAAMRETNHTSLWLGILLLTFAAAETWALPKKMRLVLAAPEGHRKPMLTVFVLWMLHAAISILLLFVVVSAFGWTPAGQGAEGLPGWYLTLIVIMTLKELYLIGSIVMMGQPETPTTAADAPAPALVDPTPVDPAHVDPTRRLRRLEPLLDGLLIAYACVAYSSIWALVFRSNEAYSGSIPQITFHVLIGAICFLLLYLPLRIPYWIGEVGLAKTRSDAVTLALSLLAAMVPALLLF